MRTVTCDHRGNGSNVGFGVLSKDTLARDSAGDRSHDFPVAFKDCLQSLQNKLQKKQKLREIAPYFPINSQLSLLMSDPGCGQSTFLIIKQYLYFSSCTARRKLFKLY